MKREKVTIYYNKTLFISAIIICVILITMPLSIMIWLTNGFRELGNRTGFFSTLFFLLAGLASNRRLRDAELCQINNVRVGPGMIKIRYNKKNYEQLLSIVPSRIALSLQAPFKDTPPKRFNFCI